MYITTLPVAEARAHLSQLIDEAASAYKRFGITRNGKRAALLLGADDYDSLCETIVVLSDLELLRDHVEGLAAISEEVSNPSDYLEVTPVFTQSLGFFG